MTPKQEKILRALADFFKSGVTGEFVVKTIDGGPVLVDKTETIFN